MENVRKGPLKNLRVIEIANVIAGPFASSLLADYGADVIKVEMPGAGDPFRAMLPHKDGESLRWISMGRNKRCITLNLQAPEGKEIFLQLVKDADIVIENFRPGTIEKWGIGFDVMKSANPKIVLARISGYGQSGPYREKAGFGTPATAFSGMTALQGYPDRPPISPPMALADMLAGMFADIGALSVALAIARGDLQEGQEVDVSLYEPIVRMLEQQIADFSVNGVKPACAPMPTGAASPCCTVKTGDSKWVVLVASTQKTWERVPAAMGKPELLQDPRFLTNPDRVKNNEALEALIREWAATLTMQELCDVLDKNGVPACPANEVDDLLANPQLQARQSIATVRHPKFGDVHVPGIVPKFSDTPGEIRHIGPAMGAYNEEVYKQLLGMSDADYKALIEKKII